jgi:hypothetical protein
MTTPTRNDGHDIGLMLWPLADIPEPISKLGRQILAWALGNRRTIRHRRGKR